mgnify:CR=1 FL=1
MVFREGDPVMHWTYGLGRIMHLEERDLFGSTALYYAVEVGELTVWVPVDGKLESRLRPPMSGDEFARLLPILSSAGEPLPDDRNERRLRLQKLFKDGLAESLCYIIRDLSAYQSVKALNDNDQLLLKQARTALLGEWGFALSLTPAQAEREMHQLLSRNPESEE